MQPKTFSYTVASEVDVSQDLAMIFAVATGVKSELLITSLINNLVIKLSCAQKTIVRLGSVYLH